MDALFSPKSIAVVGATPAEHKIGYAAMKNAAEFEGPVYGVNPNRSGNLFGRPLYGSLEEIESGVELVLVAVPAVAVPDVLRDCAKIDAKGAVVFSGGFSEADEKGAALEQEVNEIAGNNDIEVLGPNTAGFVNPEKRVVASFVSGMNGLTSGRASLVGQSGGMTFTGGFEQMFEGRGISKLVGLGNGVSLGPREVISYLDDDPKTEAIGLHLEGTSNARGLLETCRKSKTPVVIYKVGKSDVNEFARSHTGSMAGDFRLYESGFKQYKIPTAESLVGLLDSIHVLSMSPVSNGKNVGLISAQAGPGITISDRLQQTGAVFPEFSDSTRDRIKSHLPDRTFMKNPVDTGFPGEGFGEIIEAVALDSKINVLVIYEIFEEGVKFPIDDLKRVRKQADCPIVFGTAGPPDVLPDWIQRVENIGIPVVRTPERTADAVSTLLQFSDCE